MSKLLSKVGRDPKTCSAQITAFCGGVNGTKGLRKNEEIKATTTTAGGRDEGFSSGNGSSEEQKSGRKGTASKRRRGSHKDTNARARRDDGTADLGKSINGKRAGFNKSPPPQLSSTACLAEVLACFGFVFEGAGAATKPSVAEAFAMLRLHAQPAEARAAGEATRR